HASVTSSTTPPHLWLTDNNPDVTVRRHPCRRCGMSADPSPVPRPRRPAPARRRWRPTLPPAVAGILAVLRLLPRVHQVGTWLFAVGVVASAVLPPAVAVATGLLVGSIPAAVDGGLG